MERGAWGLVESLVDCRMSSLVSKALDPSQLYHTP
jgi:hypothetical protein